MLTAAGALVLTALDAVLLQQKKAFFTGGFLSVNHTRSALEALAFVGASLLADAAVLGVFVALALVIASRLMLTPRARVVAVLSLATAPLVAIDFLKYRLLAYLGDAFDLSLMFDLTGHQPAEFLAVSSAHLTTPLAIIALASTIVGCLVWILNRVPRRAVRVRARVPRDLVIPAALLFLSGLVISASVRSASDTMDEGLKRKPAGGILDWATKRLTDFDADGYGIAGTMTDPDPFDRRVFPYAQEIEGNGIDENGVAGDLPIGLPPYQGGSLALEWRRRPDVVLFVLESFRADEVGRVVGGRPVTPVLERLARSGISVRAAFSHNGYTAQSRFHALAGSFVNTRDGGTLIDDFKANGYEVAYVSGQDESFGGQSLGIGFERADFAYDARQDRGRRYSTFTTPGSLAVPHSVVQQRIAEFLLQRKGDRPLFLYVNFHDTHYPYHHRDIQPLVSDDVLREEHINPGRAAELRSMYDNSAANVDRAIGETLDLVAQRLGRKPAVVVTADHGESLFDEGFLGHGYALNDAQTRIPLIATGVPLRIDEPFGQVDLRHALGEALSEPEGTLAPFVASRPGKVVFQYLGNLDRPRQIAFATGSTRRIFDFRTHRYQEDGGDWIRPEDLRGTSSEQYLDLVRYWERVTRATGTTATSRDQE